jgi:hypothetical protein
VTTIGLLVIINLKGEFNENNKFNETINVLFSLWNGGKGLQSVGVQRVNY